MRQLFVVRSLRLESSATSDILFGVSETEELHTFVEGDVANVYLMCDVLCQKCKHLYLDFINPQKLLPVC